LFLTTQYLDEADQLADNIVVVDHGRIIAQGTPLELKDQSGAASLVVTVSRPGEVQSAADIVRAEVGEIHVDGDARRITAPAEGVGALTRIAALLDEAGIDLDDIGLQRPSLDDVFLNLTGHRAEVEQESSHDDQTAEAVR
jgi:ABC-2 type transport system ATP-binding protein